MLEFLPDHKLITAEEMYGALRRLMAKRRVSAGQSQYDVMVCVRSVDAAREVLDSIPIEGTVSEYGRVVEAALDAFCNDYNDPDGEYTSKGNLGDVCLDVYRLLESQKSSERVDIDRKEAHEVLLEEMNALARLTPRPPTGLSAATVKTDAHGAAGHHYFVEMRIQESSNECFAIQGGVFSNSSSQFPVLEERLEFDFGHDK